MQLAMLQLLVGLSAGLNVRASVLRARTPTMGLFDSLAAAFDNDDTLGEAGPAGLKQKAEVHTITWVGPQPEGPAAFFAKQPLVEQEAIAGQSLRDLAQQAGIPIKYSCMQGTCHICDVDIDGVATPTCTAVCPKRDMRIEYRDEDQALAYAKEAIKAERLAAKGKVVPTQLSTEGSEEPRQETYRERMEREMLEQSMAAEQDKRGWPFG